MTNILTKTGLLFFSCMIIGDIIVWVTNLIDINGKIGASIIITSIGFGIGFAFLVRGNQLEKYNKMKKGNGTHE